MSTKKVFQVPCSAEIFRPTGSKSEPSQSLIFSAVTETKKLWRAGDRGTITITFGDYPCSGCTKNGAWSTIGNESSETQPSMNLGFIDQPFDSFEWNGVANRIGSNLVVNSRDWYGERILNSLGNVRYRGYWVRPLIKAYRFRRAKNAQAQRLCR
jgi:hypothetical protein